MEQAAQYYTPNMTADERQRLIEFQSRINEAGELEPEKTIIQESELVSFDYFAEMSNDEYHNGEDLFKGIQYKDVLSAGKLKECITPLHLKRYLEKDHVNSENLNTGSAFHSLILEPEKFEYRLFDDTKLVEEIMAKGFVNARATKEYKQWYEQFKDEDGELAQDVLRKDVFQAMWKLKKKLMNDDVVQCLFSRSQREISVFGKFRSPGNRGKDFTVKVRPDALKLADYKDMLNFNKFGVNLGDLIIISVKTTLDASPAGFLKQCVRLGYNVTEAFYNDVIERWARKIKLIEPGNRVKTIFLTIEKDQNVPTGHYMLRPCSDEFLTWGRKEYQERLNVYLNSSDLSEGYEVLNEGSIICPISAPYRFMS